MWAVNSPCPEFRVSTSAGVVGPGDFRGRWLALLHCTRPCAPGCAVCLERFGALGARLEQYNCRLVVALDEPDDGVRALLARPLADSQEAAVFGTWQVATPFEGAATTMFALIDPEGTVRAATEMPNLAPLPVAVIEECVDRVLQLGCPDLPGSGALRTNDTYGCVGWFNYDRPHR